MINETIILQNETLRNVTVFHCVTNQHMSEDHFVLTSKQNIYTNTYEYIY